MFGFVKHPESRDEIGCFNGSQILRHSLGFSLIELLAGIAVFGVVGLTTSQYISNQLKSYKNIGQQYDMDDLVNQIRSFLSEREVCTRNFVSKNPTNQISYSRLNSANPPFDSIFSTGQDFGDVTISKMTLGGAIQKHSDDFGSTNFNITLQKRSASLASRERTFSINLAVNFDTNASTISECYGVSLEGPADWTSQSSGINYGGNVGIGLPSGEAPQNLLHIKDDTHHQLQFFGPSKTIVDGSSTEYKERVFYSESLFKDPNEQHLNAGSFVLKDNTSQTIARVHTAVGNLGTQNYESGLRADVASGSDNRAGEFSIYETNSLSDYYYKDSDSKLIARSKSAYWTASNDYIALESTAHNNGNTKAQGRLGYATSGGKFYAGHFSGEIGLKTESCTSCSVVSEMMQVSETPDNGSVMCLDQASGKLAPCQEDRSRLVIGVAQELAEMVLRRGCAHTLASEGAKNGINLGILNTQEWRGDEACRGWYPIALMGLSEETRVVCSHKGTPLKKGDLLVTSTKRGHLRALASDESKPPSFQIVGRAMSSCGVDDQGELKETDTIHVLVK